MALRPVDFTVNRPPPSLISQAFASALGAGLGALVTSPFEEAREKRVSALEQTRTETENIQNNYVEATSAHEANLRQAGFPTTRVTFQSAPGREFFPRKDIEAATQSNAPADPYAAVAVTHLLETIPGLKKKLADAGVSGPLTVGGLKEVQQVSPELINEYGINMRESALQGDAKAQARIAFYKALEISPEERKQSIGKGIFDPSTGRLRPLSQDEEIAYFKRGVLTGMLTDPDQNFRSLAAGFKPLLDRFTKQPTLLPLPIMTQKDLEDETARATKVSGEGLADISEYTFPAAQGGLMYKTDPKTGEHIPITNTGEMETHLRGNLDKLQALIMYRRNRTVAEYFNAIHMGGAQLSPAGLAYYQMLVKDDPNAAALDPLIGTSRPADVTPVGGDTERGKAVKGLQAISAAATDETRRALGIPTGERPDWTARIPVDTAQARTAGVKPSPALPTVEVPENAGPFYTMVYKQAFPVLFKDLAQYYPMSQRMQDIFGTVDAALTFGRKKGIPESLLRGLTTGTDRQKKIHLGQLRARYGDAITAARREALKARTGGATP